MLDELVKLTIQHVAQQSTGGKRVLWGERKFNPRKQLPRVTTESLFVPDFLAPKAPGKL